LFTGAKVLTLLVSGRFWGFSWKNNWIARGFVHA